MSEYQDVLNSSLVGRPVDTKIDDAVLVPEGFRIADLQSFKNAPRRIAGNIDLIEVQSFINYLIRYADDRSIIKADLKNQQFTAILDYHLDSNTPGWGNHLATYNCPTAREWSTWLNNNKNKMTQASFAEFIENNQLDIAPYEGEGPSSADMLEVSRNLQANKKVEFKSSLNLSNGDVGFEYQATTEGVSGSQKGKIEVPQEFFILIPVYEGDAAYPIKARLRYRINDGVLSLWYELVEPEKVLQDAFKHMLEQIEKGVPKSVEIYRART